LFSKLFGFFKGGGNGVFCDADTYRRIEAKLYGTVGVFVRKTRFSARGIRGHT
jgi:hypothetical protein